MKVPFVLEALTNYNPSDTTYREDSKRDIDTITDLKILLKRKFPNIETGVIFSSNPKNGPGLEAYLDYKEFRKAFGDGLTWRPTILFVGTYPFLFPAEVYPSWFQTGDLTIPDYLKGHIKKVEILRKGIGSFRELTFFKPQEFVVG